jgi:hypothetical protein
MSTSSRLVDAFARFTPIGLHGVILSVMTFLDNLLGLRTGTSRLSGPTIVRACGAAGNATEVKGGMRVEDRETSHVRDEGFLILFKAKFGGAVGGGRGGVNAEGGRDGKPTRRDGNFFVGPHEHLICIVVGLAGH